MEKKLYSIDEAKDIILGKVGTKSRDKYESELNRKDVIKFAFLPTKVENKLIWFKNYIAIYEYKWTSWNECQTSGILLQNQTEVTKLGYKWVLVDKKLLHK